MIAVIKMRGSQHDNQLRTYEVTAHGLNIGAALTDFRGIVTGVAQRAVARLGGDTDAPDESGRTG